MTTARAQAADPIDVELSEASDQGSRPPLTDQLASLGHHITRFVTTRPLTAVGIAVAVGFVLGRQMRR